MARVKTDGKWLIVRDQFMIEKVEVGGVRLAAPSGTKASDHTCAVLVTRKGESPDKPYTYATRSMPYDEAVRTFRKIQKALTAVDWSRPSGYPLPPAGPSQPSFDYEEVDDFGPVKVHGDKPGFLERAFKDLMIREDPRR